MRANLDQKTPVNQTPKREQTTQNFSKKKRKENLPSYKHQTVID